MNYDELERIAKAATPGPWGKYSDHGSYVANDKGEIAKCLPAPSLQMGWNNADHIAAFSPDRCLKLIASLRKAKEALGKIAAFEKHEPGLDDYMNEVARTCLASLEEGGEG